MEERVVNYPAIDRVLSILREKLKVPLDTNHEASTFSPVLPSDGLPEQQLLDDRDSIDTHKKGTSRNRKYDELIERRIGRMKVMKATPIVRDRCVNQLVIVLRKYFNIVSMRRAFSAILRYADWKRKFKKQLSAAIEKLQTKDRSHVLFSPTKVMTCIRRLGKIQVADSFREWSLKRKAFLVLMQIVVI